MAISAYNNSFHSSIKMTPYEAQFGRPSVIVADIIMNHQLPANTRLKDISEFTVALRSNAARINELIRENTIKAQLKQKYFYDRFVKDRATYNIGDMVKITNYRYREGHSKAFEPKYLGPFEITKLLGELNYQLESPNLQMQIVHYNRMSRYHQRRYYRNQQQTENIEASISGNSQDAIQTSITPNVAPIFFSIAQNTRLQALKKKAAQEDLKEFQRLGGIDISNNQPINACQAIVPWTIANYQLHANQSVISSQHQHHQHLVRKTMDQQMHKGNGSLIVHVVIKDAKR